MRYVLTIAGHDLSHGAGITKDLEVFSYLGLHGLSVPTSYVIQGPEGATGVVPVPTGVFSRMLERAAGSFSLSGIKIGVLPDAPHVERVVEFLAGQKGVPVVLDPVIAAKNNLRVITGRGFRALVERLLPMGPSVTPNIDEAEMLVRARIDDIDAMERAARAIAQKGPRHVFLKGGHLAGEPVDLLFDGTRTTTYTKGRIERMVHGTGCIFSSALLSFMALDYPVREAFLETERLVERLLPESHRPAEGGYYYAFPALAASRDAARWDVLQAMQEAVKRLEELNMVELIPAARMDMGYALRGADGTGDVAAFPGLIGSENGRVSVSGMAEFGVSSRAARMCLACMGRYPYLRAAVTIRYDQALVERAREKGLSAVFRDGRQEQVGVKTAGEGGLDLFMGGAMEGVLSQTERPPDMIYDTGGAQKEPAIWLFARDPGELIKKMEMMRPWRIN
jgi:hydroxymethylpyrimidine/phosphomethylpyrimidine kinase